MNGFSGYNKILIAIKDIPKTAFRCPVSIGTFEWLVMPFGLKNASAAYQRAINANFHDMLGHHMEVYIYDIVVKSKRASEHVDHLRKSFERMKHHHLKLNPLHIWSSCWEFSWVPSSPKRDRSRLEQSKSYCFS